MMPSCAILAGGLATRLHPITQTVPKALLEIAGKPFIAHQLELLRKNGVTKVILCAGYLGERIQNVVKDGRDFDLTVQYSFDGEQLLGTGGSIKKALPLLDDPFFVMYGDSYLDIEFKPIIDYYRMYQKKGLMTVFKNEGKWDTSNIVYEDNKIVTYDKIKKNPDMKYIDYGLSILQKDCFADFREGQPFDLAVVLNELVRNRQMSGYKVRKRFYEIGSFQGLEETRAYLTDPAKINTYIEVE
ncbi:nucleotidyltransferase family protein [Desulfococcaceae bacterium HSG9]|nr:nucleotidyltransferase family protein [Desulfococcaceae bacterium HSG9]